MNKKLLALAVAGALAAPLSAQAVDVSSYGKVGFLGIFEKDVSARFTVDTVRLGFKAVDQTSAGTFIGEIEFDLDNLLGVDIGIANKWAGADVRKARVIWATQGAGAFVFAPRTPSGNFDDMVAQIDIFGISKGPGMFSQGSHVGSVLAWKSPTTSGLYGVVALVGDDGGATDDADADATVWRLVYNGGGLKVGVGAVSYADDGLAAAAADRTNIGVSYTMGNLYFGGSYEDNDTTDSRTNLGLVASMTAGANTFKIGHTTRSSDSADDGAAVTELEVAHSFSKNTSGFVSYWTQNEEAGDSNAFNFGLAVAF